MQVWRGIGISKRKLCKTAVEKIWVVIVCSGCGDVGVLEEGRRTWKATGSAVVWCGCQCGNRPKSMRMRGAPPSTARWAFLVRSDLQGLQVGQISHPAHPPGLLAAANVMHHAFFECCCVGRYLVLAIPTRSGRDPSPFCVPFCSTGEISFGFLWVLCTPAFIWPDFQLQGRYREYETSLNGIKQQRPLSRGNHLQRLSPPNVVYSGSCLRMLVR